MPKTRPPMPAQFRQQMLESVEADKALAERVREFDVSAPSIRAGIGGWTFEPWRGTFCSR